MTDNARSILILLAMLYEGVSARDVNLSPEDFDAAIRELEAGFRAERQKAGDSLNPVYILVGSDSDRKV